MPKFTTKLKCSTDFGDAELKMDVDIELPLFNDELKNDKEALDEFYDEKMRRIKEAVEEKLPADTKCVSLEYFYEVKDIANPDSLDTVETQQLSNEGEDTMAKKITSKKTTVKKPAKKSK